MVTDKPMDLYDGAERLAGRASVAWQRSWQTTALHDADAFEADLGALDLSEAEVADLLRARDEAAERAFAREDEAVDPRSGGDVEASPSETDDWFDSRRSLAARFADRVLDRRFLVDEKTTYQLRVPLFELAAPEPDGCLVTFSKERMTGLALGWGVSLFGGGLGGSSSIRVSSVWTFQASAGQRKQVFLPVTVTVGRITVMSGDRVVSRSRQVLASEATPATQPGLVLLPPDPPSRPGALLDSFPIAGDTSGAPATYGTTYKSSSQRRLEFGAEVFGVGANLSAEVTIDDDIGLSLDLSGGHDYALHGLERGEGLSWVVS